MVHHVQRAYPRRRADKALFSGQGLGAGDIRALAAGRAAAAHTRQHRREPRQRDRRGGARAGSPAQRAIAGRREHRAAARRQGGGSLSRRRQHGGHSRERHGARVQLHERFAEPEKARHAALAHRGGNHGACVRRRMAEVHAHCQEKAGSAANRRISRAGLCQRRGGLALPVRAGEAGDIRDAGGGGRRRTAAPRGGARGLPLQAAGSRLVCAALHLPCAALV